jgi:hypothetical protein
MRVRSSATATLQNNAATEVSSLLARYPNLGEAALARLINLYRGLPLLDSALLMTDATLAPRLDAFVAEHRSAVRTPLADYPALLLLAGTAAALLMTLVLR